MGWPLTRGFAIIRIAIHALRVSARVVLGYRVRGLRDLVEWACIDKSPIIVYYLNTYNDKEILYAESCRSRQ